MPPPSTHATGMGFRRLLVYDNNMRLGEAMRHVWGMQHTRHCRMYRMLMQEAGDDEAKREHAHNAIMLLLSEFIHSDVFRLNYVVLGREGYLLGECDVCGRALGKHDMLMCRECHFGKPEEHSLQQVLHFNLTLVKISRALP